MVMKLVGVDLMVVKVTVVFHRAGCTLASEALSSCCDAIMLVPVAISGAALFDKVRISLLPRRRRTASSVVLSGNLR